MPALAVADIDEVREVCKATQASSRSEDDPLRILVCFAESTGDENNDEEQLQWQVRQAFGSSEAKTIMSHLTGGVPNGGGTAR